jgi:Phage integrase family
LRTLLSFHLKEFFSFVFFLVLSSLHRRPRLVCNLSGVFSSSQTSLRSKLRGAVALDKWVLPNLGDLLLADVGNSALKGLIDKMSLAGLSPQTIVTHSKVVKMVVASAVNAEGEEVYPRKWNHNFIGMPIVDPTKQHRPTVTQAGLQGILAAVKPRYTVLVALLAGTGLRIGEALGLKADDLISECRVLYVRRSIWHGREQQPKTENAVRVIDVPEQLAQVLHEYVVGKAGYLFFHAKRHSSIIEEYVSGLMRRGCDVRVPFIQKVSGGGVARSPCTRRSDWIVARARSKPYGQVCHKS